MFLTLKKYNPISPYKNLLRILTICILTNCTQENDSKTNTSEKIKTELESTKQKQDSIINIHLKNGAWKYSYYAPDWQQEIDKGLAKDWLHPTDLFYYSISKYE